MIPTTDITVDSCLFLDDGEQRLVGWLVGFFKNWQMESKVRKGRCKERENGRTSRKIETQIKRVRKAEGKKIWRWKKKWTQYNGDGRRNGEEKEK